LLDPFLASDEDEQLPMTKLGSQKPFLNQREMAKLQSSHDPNRTNMTITGKLNPDDTIFLKVQIADKDGTSFALEMQCSRLIVSMEILFWNTFKHVLN
jgi:WNK lysine deficient protein kinase